MRVGSGPGFQLVDGGWSGLTGLQLTGVVSGRVVGGSRPARPDLAIDVTGPVLLRQPQGDLPRSEGEEEEEGVVADGDEGGEGGGGGEVREGAGGWEGE